MSTEQILHPAMTVEFNTDHFRSHERMDAMYATLGGRMEGSTGGGAETWSVGVRGLVSARAEFLDFAARGLLLDRTAAKCDDGGDHISLGMVMGPRTAVTQNGHELDMTAGALYLIDFGRPVRNLNADHHQLAVALPRAHVAAALGGRMSELGGLQIEEKTGIGAILASHMQALSRHYASLDPRGRSVGLDMLANLALVAIQTRMDAPVDADAADQLLAAARLAIRNHCADPDFNADRLAVLLNCSRSTLYRVFSRGGEGVAATIWAARLERARTMLRAGTHAGLAISDIAFRCGFLEPATFSRQFRRRYGITPSEAREGE